ncbi:hypothetical protein PybrP1_002066 [[Pythium] brassicae (nom. inval.)]|nr:hypothetical protein PybrP1_002066 [[Pythium] brassicae (nom. inval.)]
MEKDSTVVVESLIMYVDEDRPYTLRHMKKVLQDYKRVVHDVEMFLWKTKVEHRLAGLYAVDAIIRQVKYGAKDQFTKRFALHLTNTMTAVKSIPEDLQDQARHVVQEWQARGFYTTSQIEEAGGSKYSLNKTTPTASSGKLASLLSIIKKQKERQHENPAGSALPPPSILGDAPRGSEALLGSPPRSDRIRSPPSRPPHVIDSGYSHPHHPAMRGAYSNDDRSRGGALLPEPPASAAIGRRFRPTDDDSNEWADSRDLKKPRGHVHDQQGGLNLRRGDMGNEGRRKTVLCANFPRGTCRFGVNCNHLANGAGGAPPLQPPARQQQYASTQVGDGGAPPAPGSFGQAHGYGSGPLPPPPAVMATMMRMGAPQPPLHRQPSGPGAPPLAPGPAAGAPMSLAPGFFPPPLPSAVGAKPAPVNQRSDPADDDDEEAESAAPEFTLQYDDDD